MAVFHWIYGTATLEGDLGDLRLRTCGEGLRAYADALTELSRRLLAMDYRVGREDQLCWFAGKLDRDLYIVAAGGGQPALLGPERPLRGGFREQFSVFACGFDGPAALAPYRALIAARDTALFEPLKTYAWELSNGRHPALWSGPREEDQRLSRSFPKDRQYNIFPADPTRDAALWETSDLRPVALDLLSPQEARKLIDLLPNAVVTVAEEAQPYFYAPSGFVDPSLLAAKRAREAAQQVEEAARAEEAAGQDGCAPPRTEPSGFQETEEPTSIFKQVKQAASSVASKFSGFLAPSPNPAPPKAPPAENASPLRQRWDRVDRIAAGYKAQLNSRQLETVECLLEALYFEKVRAICPADLVRDWCWVRLWLGSRKGIPESTLNNELKKFIEQMIHKALYDTFEVEDLISYCESVIRVASQCEQTSGDA